MTAQQVFRNTVIILATLALAYVLVLSARIFVVVLIAILIASALRPTIIRLTRLRVPQGLAILLVYAMLLGLIITLLIGVLPPVFSQISRYIQNDWQLASRLIAAQNWFMNFANTNLGANISPIDADEIQRAVGIMVDEFTLSAPRLATELGGVVGESILAFVIGVYWLTSHDSAVNFLLQMFPLRHREEVKATIDEIETSLGNYVRGVVLVASFVGIANCAILTLLRVPNAATLGFIIGVTTMLPVIGGFLGGGLATIMALLINPLHALFTLGTFVGVQQIETHYLTPRVMSRSVGIDPILVIVAVFVGFALGGVIGAILAVPIVGIFYIVFRRWVIEPRKASVTPYTIQDGLIVLNQIGDEEADQEEL